MQIRPVASGTTDRLHTLEVTGYDLKTDTTRCQRAAGFFVNADLMDLYETRPARWPGRSK